MSPKDNAEVYTHPHAKIGDHEFDFDNLKSFNHGTWQVRIHRVYQITEAYKYVYIQCVNVQAFDFSENKLYGTPV